MKKTAKRRGGDRHRTSVKSQAGDGKALSRRFLLRRAGYGLVGAMTLGGAGTWGVNHVQTIRTEHDLSIIGQGVPVVVQVHDPQCPICNALQSQTRKALRNFSDQNVHYRIANIRTPEGTAFAAKHGVPHVTLLLFDAEGRLRDTLQGPHQAEELRPAFARLVRHG